MHELSLAGAVVDTASRHADGRRVTAVHLRVGHLRQVVPDSLEFYFEHRRARARSARARGWSRRWCRRGCAATAAATSGSSTEPAFRCPACGARATSRWSAGDEFEVESIEVEQQEDAMHRVKVRVVEDALDANNTIARANRDDFDRAGVTS